MSGTGSRAIVADSAATPGATAARAKLLRIESMIATAINTGMSIAFFFLIFGWRAVAARDLAIDFLPQSLGVGVLGGIVPALIVRSRLRRGTILPAGSTPSLLVLLRRIAIIVLLALALITLPVGLLLVAFAPPLLAPLPALMLKAAYGGALGLVTTPLILRMTLGMPPFRHESLEGTA